MATILTKKSDTSSSVPLAADLTNAAGGAELAVNTSDKRLYTKTSGGSVVEVGTNPSSLTLPNGTANGVPYLNGSKVLTSGSALTFDGTNLGIGTSSPGAKLDTKGLVRSSIGTGTGAGGAAYAFYQFGTSATATENWHIGTEGDGSFRFYNQGFGAGLERMRLDSSGNLLVGTTSGSGRIRMKQSADAHSGTFNIENFGNTNTWSFLIGSDNNLYFGYNGTSRGVFNNSTGAYTTISDRSLKKDIAEIQYGLDSVLALRPVSYMMKDQAEGERKTLGFIAQEVDEVVPESVFLMREDLYGMDKEALIPVLVKAIQEQQAMIASQSEIITALTARVTALETN